MDNKEIYEAVWSYANTSARAVTRCKQISLDEMTMGYTESSKLYSDIAAELYEGRVWVEQTLRTRLGQVI